MEATCSAGICGESDLGASKVVMTGETVRWGMADMLRGVLDLAKGRVPH